MSKSQRMQNTNGAGKSYLDVVPSKDTAKSAMSSAVKAAKKEHQELIQRILEAVRQQLSDSNQFNKSIGLRQNDIILMRIATLLDEMYDQLAEEDFAEIKKAINDQSDQILDVSQDVKGIDRGLDEVDDAIIDALVQLSNDRKKDADDVKQQLALLLNPTGETSASADASVQTYKNKKVDSIEDETSGDYKDSTVAQDFQILQDSISKQLEEINKSVSNLTGFSVLGGFVGFAMKGIGALISGVKSISGKVASLTKNVVSKVFNISKAVAGGAMKALVGTVKGIAKGVGKAIGLVGAIGKGIGAGFTKIGNGIKGFGSKIGGAIVSPFKAIGGFFKNRKSAKAEQRKEKLREKFMNFMMNMFEKLWNFIEPILDKLKIFMLITMVPIITTLATVLAIIAGITLYVIAAIIAYNWIKEKALALWEWLKNIGSMIWDVTVDALKYIFVDMWVDLGKWLWDKLVQFGKYLYDTWIDPYIVQPINEHIIKPLKELWDTKIWPVIQPFVESIQNLIDRIKSIWANFNWDENKSFIDNLMSFWDQLKVAIKEWWEGSPIKVYWDKLVDWLTNIWQKVKEWWKGTKLGQWFEQLDRKIEVWKSKLSEMSFNIPDVSMDWSNFDGWHPWDSLMKVFKFGWKTIRPFGFLASKPTEGLAQQQVSNAMKPVNNINSMNSDTNLELQRTGEEMSSKAAAAEQATQSYRQQQSMIGSQSIAELRDMREEMRKGFRDPAVVTMPVPYGSQRNVAMMNSTSEEMY